MSTHILTWKDRASEYITANGIPDAKTAFGFAEAEIAELRAALENANASADKWSATAATNWNAALESHQGVAVPAGWVLVPVQPTGVMKDVGAGALPIDYSSPSAAGNAYRAMIAAAPQPPAVKEAAPAPATLSNELLHELATLRAEFQRYQDGDAKVPFTTIRAQIVAMLEVYDEVAAAGNSQDAKDAARYRLIRKDQPWFYVVNAGAVDFEGDELDAQVDARLAALAARREG